MKRSRFSEEQIIAILKEQEAGIARAEVCRRHGISSARWVSLLRTALHLADRSLRDASSRRRSSATLPWRQSGVVY